MWTQTKCLVYVNGAPLGTSMMCSSSLGWFNIWHISCLMYQHTPALWPLYKRMDACSFGDPCTRCAWIILNSWHVKTPILCPIDPNLDEPIWVIYNASTLGIGAGLTWQTCHPMGFMSGKFSTAQHNYCVFEMETLAILEALLKWEDKLIINHLHMVTDHQALEFFKTQRRLSYCQMQWMEYFSQFDYNIQYMKGTSNKVADSLS